ncbi:RHS repeat-associated core domain-containing protein [Pseudomonas sp. R151218B TE3479]
MPATRLCVYSYDPLDRLTGQSVSTHAPVQRFYCRSRLATEIEGAINRSIVQHDEHLLALTETLGNIRQATLVATDQHRSVLQALAANKSQSFAYSPYGHRPAGGGLLSLLGFNGERADSVTGHYLLGNGYRAFNPVLMRFNSPDRFSPFKKGGINPYAYCLGDPINMIDPNGTAGVLLRTPNKLSGPTAVFEKKMSFITYCTFESLKFAPKSFSDNTNIHIIHTTQRKYHDHYTWTPDVAPSSDFLPPITTHNDMWIITSKNIKLKEIAYSKITDFKPLENISFDERYSHTNLNNHLEKERDRIIHSGYPINERFIFNTVLSNAKKGKLPGVDPAMINYLQPAKFENVAKLREKIRRFESFDQSSRKSGGIRRSP